MLSKNPYEQYKAASVVGKSQLDLTIMLYDGAIRLLRQAGRKLEERQPTQANLLLVKAKRIILYLGTSLGPQKNELADNLRRLYGFAYEKVGSANFKKDRNEIDEALTVLTRLREGWVELREQQMAAVQKPESPVSQLVAAG